jgi:hypothetical protein
MGNGSFISVSSVLIFSILMVGALSISMPNELEGPQLAALALIAQSLGHFVFGGGAIGSSMVFSHIVGGVAGYQLVKKMDYITCGFENFIRKILIPLIIELVPIFKPITCKSIVIYTARVKVFVLAGNYLLRAPPHYIVN